MPLMMNQVKAQGALASINISGPSSVTAGSNATFTVTGFDSQGNNLGNFTSQADWTINSTAQGLWTENVYTSQVSGNWTVTASVNGISNSTSLTVTPANASDFVVSAPNSTAAGVPFNVTVTAHDAYDNVATGYAGTVQVTSSDSQAVLPSNASLIDGVGTFQAVFKTAGSQSITAKDMSNNSITGTQSGITVNAGSATRLVISGFPFSVTAGSSQSVTVTAQDQYGNTATSFLGTVTITSSDSKAVSSPPATLTNGVGSFNVTLETAGTQSITATTSGITGGSQTGITVIAAGMDHITISPVGARINVGGSQTYTVNSYDKYNNLIASGVSATFEVNGVSISGHSVSETVAGSYTVSASYSGKTASTTLTVNAVNYTITVTQSVHGTISPATASYAEGASQAEIITPDSGYYIASITVDGNPVKVASSSGQTVIFDNIQMNHTITANYTQTSQPTPTPTPTPTPAPTPTESNNTPSPAATSSTSTATPTTALASIGLYLSVIAAVIILGIIIGLYISRRRHLSIIIVS
jgi:hypothetical protein